MTTTTAPTRLSLSLGFDTVRQYGIVVSFVLLFLVLALTNQAFLTQNNQLNILDQWAPTLIMALGQTVVIIAGGFDLSVSAIFAVSGVSAAMVTNSTGSVTIGIFSGILTGGLLGGVNALLVTVGRINAIIATLASTMVFAGLALALTDGLIVMVEPEGFRALGNDSFLGVKWTIWVLILAVVVAGVLLSSTTYGRWVYAIGGNQEAARLSGLRTESIRASTYAFSGLCAGVAGVMQASRIGSGQADAGAALFLIVIAGVVLGGTSIMGGHGAIWRTVLGILMLALIGNGFNLLGVDPIYQQMVTGAIILLAVGVDAWARRRT